MKYSILCSVLVLASLAGCDDGDSGGSEVGIDATVGAGGEGGAGGMIGEGGAGGEGAIGGEGGGGPAGCRTANDCMGDDFCDVATHCGAGGTPGICEARPAACDDTVNVPVCGCDNETYGNACAASAAGVSVRHDGACPMIEVRCGGDAGVACEDDQFCSFEEGCGMGGTGRCEPRPEGCRDLDAPVCGCDGETYQNACLANAAGAAIESQGACRPAGCGRDDDVCRAGQFCDTGDACGMPHLGECVAQAENCRDVDAPVCGCDAMTYDNPCLASQAGISVASDGPCRAR